MSLIIEWPLLTAGNEPDANAIACAARRAEQAGAQGVLIFGPVGEYANIPIAVQEEYVRMVSQALDKRIALIVCIQETATARCLERIQAYASIPDVQFACPLHYHFSVTHPDEIRRHYTALAAEAKNGIYALDYPALTKYSMRSSDVRLLSAISGMLGVLRIDREIAVPNYCLETDPGLPVWLTDGAGRFAPRFNSLSRLAFLYSVLPESAYEDGLNLLEIGRHPASALKYAGNKLGLCVDADPLPPYAPLDACEQKKADYLLKEIERKGGIV